MDAILSFLPFAAAVIAIGSTGAIFRPGEWYESLDKPSWRPPNWIFGPAWTLLYLMIATAGWLVWRAAGWPAGAAALGIYGLQLVLNALWSPLFFGIRRPDIAFGEILLLWGSIAATIAAFIPISTMAAWLMVPYLAWVSFAAVLNFTVWQLNKARIATGL